MIKRLIGAFGKLLRKNETLFCWCKFLRRLGKKDFREYLLDYRIGGNANSVIPGTMRLDVYSRGPLHPREIVFEIPMDTAGFGMCSQLMVMINRVNYADQMGFVPCINWYESKLYRENEPVHGTTNIFEYYFEPLNGVSVGEAEQSRFVLYDDLSKGYGFDWVHIPLVDRLYQYTELDLERYALIMKKYFHLRKDVESEIQYGIRHMFPNLHCKVLGVHGRGGDLKLNFLNHPVFVTTEEYVAAAKKTMKEMGAQYVFLATDDVEILERFEEEFGDKLLYYKDVVRSSTSLHNALMEVRRPQHKYRLGFEILRDVYTLAYCDGLITGMSAINCIARAIKKLSGKEYEVQYILDKGKNQGGVNVNDPNFLKKDAVVLKKIKRIQNQKNLSDTEKDKQIQELLDKVYEKDKKDA